MAKHQVSTLGTRVRFPPPACRPTERLLFSEMKTVERERARVLRREGGCSVKEIARSTGLARNTVRKYVAAAEAAGMVPGGPPVSQERWAELAREWFPELADTRLRQVTWPAIEVHRDYIVAQLAAGVTMATKDTAWSVIGTV